jgi:hypothetical protein
VTEPASPSLFDPETGVLALDERVAEMPSFRRIVADEVVSDAELAEHAERVVVLLRRLEAELPPAAHALLTEALCELAVLNALYDRRAMGA